MNGKFIVIEGLEGAGKSTAMHVMKQLLAASEIEFITTREPGGTVLGEVIREILKHPIPNEPLDHRTELLLFYAARIQLIEQVIRPALQRGCWVLADRFELSTFAYQGGGRQLNIDLLTTLSQHCVTLQPDCTFFLDIKPEIGLKRASQRGHLDRIEQESLEFFKLVQAAYYAKLPTLTHVKIDANQPLAMVKHNIRVALGSQIESWKN